MNYIWGIMIIVGIVYGAFTGNMSAVTEQTISSAKEAIQLCITMAGVMALWVGVMEIAEHGGIIRNAAKALSPILTLLFPNIPKNHKAREYIASNMIANFFGLGWAATPAGIQAMKELKNWDDEEKAYGESEEKKWKNKGVASDEMCAFLVINISSLQLIPVNIIAYRSQYGSVDLVAIVGPAILATCISTGAAVLFILGRRIMKRMLGK